MIEVILWLGCFYTRHPTVAGIAGACLFYDNAITTVALSGTSTEM